MNDQQFTILLEKIEKIIKLVEQTVDLMNEALDRPRTTIFHLSAYSAKQLDRLAHAIAHAAMTIMKREGKD